MTYNKGHFNMSKVKLTEKEVKTLKTEKSKEVSKPVINKENDKDSKL